MTLAELRQQELVLIMQWHDAKASGETARARDLDKQIDAVADRVVAHLDHSPIPQRRFPR